VLKIISYCSKFVLFIPLILTCKNSHESTNETTRTINLENPKPSRWEEIFEEPTEIKLDQELLSISTILVCDNGAFIIADGSDKKIKYFDAQGKFLQTIGHWGGKGPGEFAIPSLILFDEEENVLIFDVSGFTLSKFTKPNYLYAEQIHLTENAVNIIIAPDGNLITFSYSSPYMINKFDQRGKFLKRTFERDIQSARIFLARFQLGGIADVNDDGFVLIYPEEYKIYHYDYNLNLKHILQSKTSSKFRPVVSQFPEDLSPYAFTPQHSNWWDAQLHVLSILNLGHKFIGVILYESDKMSVVAYYLNVYDLEGRVLGEGMEIPFNGKILFAKKGYVFVAVDPQLGPKDEIIGPKLFRYQIKKK
jgi:hypothetical protein